MLTTVTSGERLDSATITIRARRSADMAALADILLAQQPTSRYPIRNPLPFPIEQFLHADDAVAAWTAEFQGRPVGHICRTEPRTTTDAADMNHNCAKSHGCDVDQLGWVSALFIGSEARNLGLGRRLLATVVEDICRAGLYPCLTTIPTHPAALSLYESTGWREVMRQRPDWLRDELGDDGPEERVMTLSAHHCQSPQPSSAPRS
jgi:GNAT superfamily N-acetyltransferase